ncbi:MAG TPA: tRNA 2-thiouridine(34) synthase MnmA [Candidatus Binataceae bacterium]|nr:tRNA 2-thiouridine(34) synthase MnmA [Candidatus Binataceae bacterium]
MRSRVLVAMSGGIDSSVAAALLHKQGHEVVGVAMRLAPDPPSSGVSRRGTCCSHDDFEDARRVAEQLGFPFYVVDLRNEFNASVIRNFVSEYLNGRTPNPCVICNREIKFDRLWQRAQALNADYIATGHYARIEGEHGAFFRLLRARDESKDQSYFLFTLGQKEMARTLFPLGSLTKCQVRALGRELGLPNADKPESQEICFVPEGDYAGFVARHASSESIRAGWIRDGCGNNLARHSGIHQFTVGQRRGLGIASTSPLYVRTIDAGTGDVTVVRRGDLVSAGLVATMVRLTRPELARGEEILIEAKIRYRHPAIPASLRILDGTRAEILFRNGGPAVTPGQACVFYRDDEVLGGGIIETGLNA